MSSASQLNGHRKSLLPVGGNRSNYLRKLGHNEAYQMALYTTGQYRGTSVSCRYALPSGHELAELKQIIVGAIAQTVLRHPMLQVAIAKAASRKPHWIQLDSLSLDEHVSWHQLDPTGFENELQKILISELDAFFPKLDEQPGWRVVVLHEEQPNFLEILFTWNHPHADGMSGKLFHESFLRTLSSMDTARENTSLRDGNVLDLPKSKLTLPPPTEDIVKIPTSAGLTMKSVWKEYGPAMLNKSASQAHWAPICLKPYKTHLRPFFVDPETVTKTLAVCRLKKTTLTGLLHALGVLSLATRLGADTAPAFQTKTALDFRRFLPSNCAKFPGLRPGETMANYVSIMGHSIPATLVQDLRSKFSKMTPGASLSKEILEVVWTAARRIRGDIQKRLDSGLKNDLTGLMKFVTDWRTQVSDAAKKPRDYAVIVTNLGAIKGIQESGQSASTTKAGSWSISRAQFSLSAEVASAPLCLSVASVVGGQLSVVVGWQDSVIDPRLAEGFAADVERWLLQIGGVASL